MKKHSKFSASASSRWLECTASIGLYETLEKQESSAAAQEGTLAHDLAEYCFKKNITTRELKESMLDTFNSATFKGWELTNEMCDYVQIYLDYLNDYKFNDYWLEYKLDYTSWVPEGFGTADFISYDKETRTFHVIDLKYGKGKVEADNNTQLMLYALGTYQSLTHAVDEEPEFFELHIVQPRIDYIGSFKISTSELLEFGAFAKRRALEAINNPQYRPNAKSCQWCAFNDNCKALLNHTKEILRTEDFAGLESESNELSDSDIANLILNEKLITKFIENVKQRAQNRLESGENIDGVKLVRGRGMRKWVEEDTVVSTLGHILPESELFIKKLITLTEAEKLIGKKNFNSEYSDLYFKSDGALQVAHITDKRKEEKLIDINEEFKGI
jgi:hypothetical protein